jgi:hypothetical protein
MDSAIDKDDDDNEDRSSGTHISPVLDGLSTIEEAAVTAQF